MCEVKGRRRLARSIASVVITITAADQQLESLERRLLLAAPPAVAGPDDIVAVNIADQTITLSTPNDGVVATINPMVDNPRSPSLSPDRKKILFDGHGT